jgi:predicted negative regulator of RcsB-dependent stress response
MTDHALSNLRQAEQQIEDFEAVVGRMQERIAELEVENARMRSALELIASDGGHEWSADVAKAALTGTIFEIK